MKLSDDVSVVKGVGTAMLKGLHGLGIHSIYDLVSYLPFRYEDYSTVLDIKNIAPGPVTIKAVVKQTSSHYASRGLHITEAIMSDETASVRVVWFNQPYRAAALKTGQQYYVSGLYELARQRFQILNPSAELVKDFPVNTARIVPLYRQSKAISSNQLRKLIAECVPTLRTLPETLPVWMVAENNLLSRAEAFEAMHYPASKMQLSAARRRLAFEEVVELSLASLINRQENMSESSLSIPFDEQTAKSFVTKLPFQLTNDQRRIVWQIYQDMQMTQPMNRLVEGDVGSGKTVIAAMAAVMAMRAGYQVAVMAPTELLARQHYATLKSLISHLCPPDVITLLVGSLPTSQKRKAHAAIKDGKALLLIGTHALVQEKVDMHRLGLIIIDEQHRFGVEQRKALMTKAGHMPHVLSMTATPIPRSLTLTLYGELDVSLLKNKPIGRQPIQTTIISPLKRNHMYEMVRQSIAAGRQAYVVCPIIKESAAISAASVETVFNELQKTQLKGCRIGLLHGKLSPEEKEAIMEHFIHGDIDVLVATTVIEVGVDVPNATVMVVEGAERFGLAQLHQLRGRVGRNDSQAYCYLVVNGDRPPSKRLRAIASSQDGFRLAELDLELRGPGVIYGALQHGVLDLRVVKLSDTQLIEEAHHSAQTFISNGEDLLQYTELRERVNKLRRVTNLN